MSHTLNAVNEMLGYIGEASVSSLQNTSGNLDVALAISILNTTNDMIQGEGWDFNTENRKLSPDVDGFIFLPNNMFKVNTTGYDYYDSIIERDGRLFNKDNNSFNFKYPVECELVLKFEFDKIPAAARRYIALKATLEFISSTVGDSLQYNHIREAAKKAENNLERVDEVNEDNNILMSNHEFSRRRKV